MYRQYATPLRLELQASDYSGWWLLLTHVITLLVLTFTTLSAWVQIGLAVVVLSSLRWCWPRYVSRLHQSAVTVFTWKEGCDCEVTPGRGETSDCELSSCAFVMPWLVVLYYRQGRRIQSLFILPDMLPHDAFRQLRVRLRTSMSQPVAPT